MLQCIWQQFNQDYASDCFERYGVLCKYEIGSFWTLQEGNSNFETIVINFPF